MLDKNIFTLDYIKSLHSTSKSDPILLERVIFAFGLLEALLKVNTPPLN
jgi:hypothetical protein